MSTCLGLSDGTPNRLRSGSSSSWASGSSASASTTVGSTSALGAGASDRASPVPPVDGADEAGADDGAGADVDDDGSDDAGAEDGAGALDGADGSSLATVGAEPDRPVPGPLPDRRSSMSTKPSSGAAAPRLDIASAMPTPTTARTTTASTITIASPDDSRSADRRPFSSAQTTGAHRPSTPPPVLSQMRPGR